MIFKPQPTKTSIFVRMNTVTFHSNFKNASLLKTPKNTPEVVLITSGRSCHWKNSSKFRRFPPHFEKFPLPDSPEKCRKIVAHITAGRHSRGRTTMLGVVEVKKGVLSTLAAPGCIWRLLRPLYDNIPKVVIYG